MLKSILFIYLFILTNIAFGQSPGKVASNLQWWFKANVGTSTVQDGGQIDSWVNNGGFVVSKTYRNALSTAGYPKFIASGINFNPVIYFSADNPAIFQTSPSNRSYMGPMAGNSSVFAVFLSNQKEGSIAGNVFYYTPNIISTETGVSQRDYSLGFVEGKVAVKCDTIDDWVVNTNKLYVNAGPQIAAAVRSIQTNVNRPADVQLLMNGRNEQNTNSVNTSYLLNSSNYVLASAYYGLSIGALTSQGQTSINTYTTFDGDIAELIVYDRVLTGLELMHVNSYLAIKYGIKIGRAHV